MRCTMCREEMNPLTVGNVQIDECPHCRGIWFDKGELEEAKNEVDPDLHFLDFKIWSRKALFSVSDMPLTCRDAEMFPCGQSTCRSRTSILRFVRFVKVSG